MILYINIIYFTLMVATIAPSFYYYGGVLSGVFLRGLPSILAAMALYMIFFIVACVVAILTLYRKRPESKAYGSIIKDYLFSYETLARVGYRPLYILLFAFALRTPVYILSMGGGDLYNYSRVSLVILMLVSFGRMLYILYTNCERLVTGAYDGVLSTPATSPRVDKESYSELIFADRIKELQILSNRVMNSRLKEMVDTIATSALSLQKVGNDKQLPQMQLFMDKIIKILENYNDLKYSHRKSNDAVEMMEAAISIVSDVQADFNKLTQCSPSEIDGVIAEIDKKLP